MDLTGSLFLKVFIFITGSIVGSFLNVCIYRLPRNESIVFPSSHCVHCNHTLYWFDNIPFFSYLFLRGKCRFCARPISPRYFLVEGLTALLALVFFMNFGLTPKFFFMSLLGAALIIATFIDFEFQIIPDEISIPGIFIGLLAAYLFPSILNEPTRLGALRNSFMGIVAGGGSIYMVGVLGKIIFKKEAMGGGDVKLMAAIGAFLGWKLALLIFFMAPFFGAAVGIALMIRKHIDIIPYGPYLSLATLIAVLWGGRILNYLFWY